MARRKFYKSWDEVPIYLSTQEVAALLQVNPETVRRWVRDGKLPAKKTGRKQIYNKMHIKAWQEGGMLQ